MKTHLYKKPSDQKNITNKMLNKIAYTTAVLFAVAQAEQELESEELSNARQLADDWLGSTETEDSERYLADEFAMGDDLDLDRELKSLSANVTYATVSSSVDTASSIEPTASKYGFTAWPWPQPWYRMAYCRMQYNPVHPTTYPYGAFWLYEYGPYAPMLIRGYMRQMPGRKARHGFTIKSNPFNGSTCASTGATWNPFGVSQGQMNTWPSRAGDLWPITNFLGNSTYSVWAWQPTLYGWLTVANRSMCIYERYYYNNEDYWGNEIACCNIRRFKVLKKNRGL